MSPAACGWVKDTKSVRTLRVQRGLRGAAPDKQRGVFAAAKIPRKCKRGPSLPCLPVCSEFATANVQAIGLHLCDLACE